MTTPDCAFCAIVRHEAPAKIVREWDSAIAFVPLDPVITGHVLVVPRIHVQDAIESPVTTLLAMSRAVELAAATQSIFHLHIHVIPRYTGDELMVPWGTTGDPHAPHWCKVAQRLSEELAHAENILSAVAGVRETLRRSRDYLERDGSDKGRVMGLSDAIQRLDRVMQGGGDRP